MSGELSWIKFLPSELVQAARETGSEMAWMEHDALNVLAHLQSAQCRILGVDTWTFDAGRPSGPIVLGPDWDSEASETSAARFIATFKERSDLPAYLRPQDIWFNFTVHGPSGIKQ